MLEHLRPACVLLALFTGLTGIAYPFAVTGVAQALMPAQANGSLIMQESRVIGSSLIGQPFSDPRFFHGRPSAAGNGYDAAASSGSNLGPLSRKLLQRVKADVDALRAEGVTAPIPADAVTTSASGLDPDISQEYALLQVPRIAKARGLSENSLRDLIARHTDTPALGLFGEPRVNVLKLNLALNQFKP